MVTLVPSTRSAMIQPMPDLEHDVPRGRIRRHIYGGAGQASMASLARLTAQSRDTAQQNDTHKKDQVEPEMAVVPLAMPATVSRSTGRNEPHPPGQSLNEGHSESHQHGIASCVTGPLSTSASAAAAAMRTAKITKKSAASTATIGQKHTMSDTRMCSREPLAKVFIECCGCHYFHDLPSRLYTRMSDSDRVVEAQKSSGVIVHGVVVKSVQCPWCGHEMTRRCCAGYAASIRFEERLH